MSREGLEGREEGGQTKRRRVGAGMGCEGGLTKPAQNTLNYYNFHHILGVLSCTGNSRFKR